MQEGYSTAPEMARNWDGKYGLPLNIADILNVHSKMGKGPVGAHFDIKASDVIGEVLSFGYFG